MAAGATRFWLWRWAGWPMSDWQRDALCAQTDPELFFPEKGMPAHKARTVCMACEVRPQCLEFALTTGQVYGVWGGYTEQQRRLLRRFRRARLAG